VTASDDHAGALTLVGLTDVDGDTVADDLAPGASATYSGSYVPVTSPSTNTVTASGDEFSADGQMALGVSPSDSASATCASPTPPAALPPTGGGQPTAPRTLPMAVVILWGIFAVAALALLTARTRREK
jgi:hypothetical protein